MKYESANYMRHLGEFILSEGEKYQDLEPVQEDLLPRKAAGSFDDGLDGWSYMMRTRGKDFALLYFENASVKPSLEGFTPGKGYSLTWFDPQTGEWGEPFMLKADEQGALIIPSFPDLQNTSVTDWALKILRQ
jgi:hypothetical protein